MGFPSGFAGGVTVTLGVAYLTILAHERNRQAQGQALRSQSRVLQTLYEPEPISPPRSRIELAREERGTFAETAKDRWNKEIENAVRWVQRKDWNDVREGIEGSASRLLGGGLQKSREGIDETEKHAGPTIQETIDKSRAVGKSGIEAVAGDIDRAATAAIAGTERAGESAHDVADAVRNSGGTIDAARNAVRGVVSKGIEKGREALEKAQDAAGLGEQSKAREPSAVEKALQKRYEKRPEQSVEEALAERYKTVESKDKTVLRGV